MANQGQQNSATQGLYIPPFPEFVIDDITTAGARWDKYIKNLDRLFTAADIEDTKRQRALLLYYVGQSVCDVFDTFTDTGTDYKTALDKLTAHFSPKRNPDFYKCLLGEARQHDGESIVDFYVRLQQMAVNCEFTATDKDSNLKTQILRGMRSSGFTSQSPQRKTNIVTAAGYCPCQ